MLELAAPIRLYWDMDPGQPADDYVERVCADAVAMRLLAIHLDDPGATLSAGTRLILERLLGPGRAILLTLNPDAAGILDQQTVAAVRHLYIRVTSPRMLTQVFSIRDRLAPLSVGISMALPDIPLADVPQMVLDAAATGIREIHFPMQRLTAGAACWAPSPSELDTCSRQLLGHAIPDQVRLTIHDPFIWRSFHAGLPFPNGGCQAANTMLYLAPDGQLYSCPLVPVALGNLHDLSLLELATGNKKQMLREQIRGVPPICGACPDLASCHAGCRGRAMVLGGWMANDPACGR